MQPVRLAVLALAFFALAGCGSNKGTTPEVDVEVPTVAEQTPAPPPPVVADAEWTVRLDPASKLTFVATKNGDVEVPGSFTKLSGGLKLDPADLNGITGNLQIKPGSVDTAEVVRDLNIREALFGLIGEALGEGEADITQLSLEKQTLAVGESTTGKVDLKLLFLGHRGAAFGRVEVARTNETTWSVKTLEPVVLSLAKLGMADQAEALRARCEHEELGDTVAVSVELVFASI